MKQLQLNYEFQNHSLLTEAITHSSYANEQHCACNERLEFLGDSVLSLIISNELFLRMPEVQEGELSKLRASLVCEQSLAELAERLHLGEALLLGHGEELSGGRKRASILSDAFEALLAAIYLDSDFFNAKTWLLALMEDKIEDAVAGKSYHDYKTIFQERVQKKGGRIEYQLLRESGPDHQKDFFVALLVNGKEISKGKGGSKKEAEQHAAKQALERWK